MRLSRRLRVGLAFVACVCGALLVPFAVPLGSQPFNTQIQIAIAQLTGGTTPFTNFRGVASAYINWGSTLGTTGYGFRDNGGTMEAKNSGGSWTAIISGSGGAVTAPGGRLTAQCGVPIQTSDQVGVSSVCYSPYDSGSTVPVNGTTVSILSGPTDTTGLSLTLNSSAHLANTLYDIFVAYDSATLRLCAGPAWSNSGAGTSTRSGPGAVSVYNGVFVNTASMTCTYGSSSFTVAARAGTQLGTFMASANGQTTVQQIPAAVAGGPNTKMFLCNAYNREPVSVTANDSTAGWLYAGGLRNANNSASNRINFVVCQPGVLFHGEYVTSVAGDIAAATAATVLVGINSQATCGVGVACALLEQGAVDNGSIGMGVEGHARFHAAIGFNYLQASEESTLVAINFLGNDFMQLLLEGEF